MSAEAFREAADERRELWERETDKRILRLFVLIAIAMSLGGSGFGLLFWWSFSMQERIEDQRYVNQELLDGLQRVDATLTRNGL